MNQGDHMSGKHRKQITATQLVARLVIATLIGTVAGMWWLAEKADAVEIDGNPSCADIGFTGIEFKDDPPSLFQFDNGTIRIAYFDAYTVSGVVNLRPHDFDLEAVIVKGGPSATVQIGGPYTGLSAPALDNGNVPAISHVSVCLTPKEPTTTTQPTTTTTDPKTTTTTEVPPSTTLPPTTTTTSPPTTTQPEPPSSSTSPPTTSATPPTSTVVTTPTPPTSPPNSTAPPSTTTTPETGITQQGQERPSELPYTGAEWWVLLSVAAGLVASGVAAVRRSREV